MMFEAFGFMRTNAVQKLISATFELTLATSDSIYPFKDLFHNILLTLFLQVLLGPAHSRGLGDMVCFIPQ